MYIWLMLTEHLDTRLLQSFSGVRIQSYYIKNKCAEHWVPNLKLWCDMKYIVQEKKIHIKIFFKPHFPDVQ